MRSFRRLAAAIAMGVGTAVLLAGCSGSAIVDALTPRDGYRVERDIPYGPDPRQRLDLYHPGEPRPGAPAIVFFYGGRWESGDKATYRFVAQALASRGYTVAVPDYRLHPQVRWRGFLADGAAAVAAVAGREGNGAAGAGVVLAGHSAGAYIAAMLAFDAGRLAAAGLEPCRVRSLVGLAGPYNFLPLEDDDLRAIFGPGPAGPETQPITYVDASAPPALLVIGADDETVVPANSESLAARLRDAGVPVTLRRYDGIGHVGLVASLAAPLRFLAPTLDDVDAHLRALPPACPA